MFLFDRVRRYKRRLAQALRGAATERARLQHRRRLVEHVTVVAVLDADPRASHEVYLFDRARRCARHLPHALRRAATECARLQHRRRLIEHVAVTGVLQAHPGASQEVLVLFGVVAPAERGAGGRCNAAVHAGQIVHGLAHAVGRVGAVTTPLRS